MGAEGAGVEAAVPPSPKMPSSTSPVAEDAEGVSTGKRPVAEVTLIMRETPSVGSTTAGRADIAVTPPPVVLCSEEAPKSSSQRVAADPRRPSGGSCDLEVMGGPAGGGALYAATIQVAHQCLYQLRAALTADGECL
jgi:hypothetical protein